MIRSAVASLLIFATACHAVKSVGGEIGGHAAEWIACPTGILECGHVFMCEGTPRDNPLGIVEICIDDDDHPEQLDAIESTYGMCSPTSRHEGLCWYGCKPHDGCNAYDGCYCPAGVK